MQTINGNITDFGLEAKVTTLIFTIVNRFLKPIDIIDKTSNIAPSLTQTIETLSDGSFSLSLWENDAGERFSFYLITTPNNKTFSKYIYIPFSHATSLHIDCLKQIGGCGDIITVVSENERLYAFNDDFLVTIDKFMMDESTFLTRSRQRAYQNFCDFVDEENETKKCDVFNSLDIKLGQVIDQYGENI